MSTTSVDTMRAQTAEMLKGIERYNPNNIVHLEKYVQMQSKDGQIYDLEANLALLKLYQFNPTAFDISTVTQILLKALMSLPRSDFVCCKALLSLENLDQEPIKTLQYLSDLLEQCQFKDFWEKLNSLSDLIKCVVGFENAIRTFACHVISNTYQSLHEETLCELLGLKDEAAVNRWISKNGWKQSDRGFVLITNQDEQIKTKKITENIEIENVANIMASCF